MKALPLPRTTVRFPLFVLASVALVAGARGADVDVKVMRLPEGALQPHVVPAGDGTAHLLYFKGAPEAGDVYYARVNDAGAVPDAVRVNTHAGSAVALGNVRGPQMAVGKNGRVHVAWNGSASAEPKAPGGAAPLVYTRLGDDGRTFEPERNLITSKVGLDGGGTVAADAAGNVYVVWHAPDHKNGNEQDRRVYLATSRDEGKTFAPEVAITDGASGACGCCGMGALAVGRGTLVLYRGAAHMTDRATYLLASTDAGATFRATKVAPMDIGMCIMSTYAMALTPDSGALVAYETNGRVFVARVDPAQGVVGPAVPVASEATKQKHPAIGIAPDGKVLVAWAEGTGFKKGGTVAWRLFDPSLEPMGPRQSAPGLPASSFPAVWVRGDRDLVVVY